MSGREHRTARRRRVALVALVMAVTLAAGATSQIVAPAGRTLFNQGLLVRSLLRLDTFERSRDGEELTRLRHVSALVWGARPNTSLSVVVPVERTERDGGGRPGATTTGTGDAAVFARHDAVRRNVAGGYTRLAPELGVKLPTGGAAGSGSTDLVAGLVFSRVRDPDWWIADVQVTSPGTGDEGVRAGERRRVDIAYLRRVVPRRGLGVPMVLLVLELNGESVNDSRRDGAVLPGTGGDLVYLSPGIEYIVGRRLVLEASVPIPVYEHLGEARPRPRVSAIVGMRWLF